MRNYFITGLLTFLFSANWAAAVGPKFDEAQRFIFYSVLEGLYDDGVSTKDVEQILMKREGEEYFHFIYACPVCMGSVWAFEAYRDRPVRFHSVKSGASTFGEGLEKEIRDELHSDEVKRRLTVINKLIGRWIERRMDRLRLTEKERAELNEKLAEKREEGMTLLKDFSSKKDKDGGFAVEFFAPAYSGQEGWQCAACNAAVGKPMDFGEKKEGAKEK